MATTPTTRVTDLSRSHQLDVDIATYPTVNYQQVIGREDFKFIEEIRTEADEVHDSNGAMRETNTGYSWRIELKLAFSLNLAGTLIDPVHLFMRNRFKGHRSARIETLEFGARFYRIDGIDDAHSHEGRVYAKVWNQPGGQGRKAIDVTLQGQGSLADLVNPNANPLPTVAALLPTTGGTAGGNLVQIYGTHFTGVSGAAGVKFGLNNATSYIVVNDGHIVAIAPAGSAATIQVKVTNGAGASADTAADDYTYA